MKPSLQNQNAKINTTYVIIIEISQIYYCKCKRNMNIRIICKINDTDPPTSNDNLQMQHVSFSASVATLNL